MKCPNCGNENPPDYLFCDECGARLIGNDVAAATDDDSGNMQSQDTGGGGDSGVTPYISDNAQSDVDAPISTYGDYNVGVGMGTGDTVAEGLANADEQSGSAAADTAPPDNLATTEAAVPVTEDTVSTGQDADQDADDTAMPVQPMAQAADADDSAVAHDTTSAYDSGSQDPTSAYQDAAASVSGVADDARQAVDEDVADLGNMDWMSSAPSVASNQVDEAVPAPSGGQGTSAAPAGNDWAAHALSLLDQAQSSLSSGDWGTFGHSMNDLRAALQNVAGGAAGVFAQAQTMGAAGNAASTASADQSWNGAAVPDYAAAVSDYSEPTSSAQSADYGIPAPSPMGPMPQASNQGMGAMPEPSYMGAPSPQVDLTANAGMGDSGAATQEPTLAPAVQPIPVSSTSSGPMTSTAPAGTGARLILISSGAEMALPDQEEITVGREDPSSGIFPDVHLTPHGGEDGGVSRRHARLLHVGDDYFVEDLQSTNFTKLDGQRLPAHVRERLDDGARIDFGRVAMIFRQRLTLQGQIGKQRGRPVGRPLCLRDQSYMLLRAAGCSGKGK